MHNIRRGIALTIGLNSFDPTHYNGESGTLFGCENDARDMANIALANKFEVTTLLTKDATRDNVLKQISQAAAILQSGDIFMVSYSGHGGWLWNKNQDQDNEDDLIDETWCLYDGQLVDDELYYCWSKFNSGVRIFVTSDSCHSGSILRNATIERSRVLNEPRKKAISRKLAKAVYKDNKNFYDKILTNKDYALAFQEVKASVLLISACQDYQSALDGDENSIFTSLLLQVWDNGNFKATGEKKGYRAFHEAILILSPQSQTPNYFRVGKINEEFEIQKPYTI